MSAMKTPMKMTIDLVSLNAKIETWEKKDNKCIKLRKERALKMARSNVRTDCFRPEQTEKANILSLSIEQGGHFAQISAQFGKEWFMSNNNEWPTFNMMMSGIFDWYCE